jgi:hypothetical protein
MTATMPRGPKLDSGTCIATPALIESSQRVFLFHSKSPLHWIDLCTLIEAIILHEKIAFPVIHRNYAEPLAKPLRDAGLLDLWWPEAGLVRGPPTRKEDKWRGPAEFGEDIQERMALLSGGWPDQHFDGLADTRKAAIDGIAHGFSEPALSANIVKTPRKSLCYYGELKRGEERPMKDLRMRQPRICKRG